MDPAEEILLEDVFVRVRPRGTVRLHMLLELLERLYDMPEYRDEKRGDLWDFRGSPAELDFEDLLQIRSYIRRHYDDSWSHERTAFVIESKYQYGLARIYEKLAEDATFELKVFEDIEEAERWLRRP